VRIEAEELVIRAVEEGHAGDPLRPSHSLAAVRAALPKWAPADLSDGVLAELVGAGRLEAAEGGVRLRGYRPVLSQEQDAASARLERILEDGGLGAPSVDELPDDLRSRGDLWSLLRRLEAISTVRQVADGLFLASSALDAAAARIEAELGGQNDLGPASFRDVLPVTRKRLLPLLHYFDGLGTTLRRGEGRDVPRRQ
jgi:selenocysteine-specific elongation factor